MVPHYPRVRRDLPSGTVTFLFTDIEGSTKLLHELGSEAYAHALAEHRRTLRGAFARHGGIEVDTQGDAFFVAFATAAAAVAAAAEATKALTQSTIRVRVGIHTGTPHVTDEGYVGADVHRAARIAAAGHGGQVLVSAATAALLDGGAVDVVDLGEHRLKDLSAAERIYQLSGGEFPPLKTLYQTNLPVPTTPFVGRDRELERVGELLAREVVRLLTLTGPGGTGKTRLALQAAAAAADRYPDGLYWVPLAPLRDPALVTEAAAHAIGARDGLANHIGNKRLLLLLDNLEHLIGAAGDVAALLSSCPNLQLLVTSRELLQVPGEQAYPVPPLEPQEGIELFTGRAAAADPDFTPDAAVPALCERLDQLPLALELAAARVRILSPEQLLERLSGRLDLLKAGRGTDPRQQTLRTTIAWSYDLLDAEEQGIFARLSVFRGGCGVDAAEKVCEADLDTLQSLVDKSLVRVRDRDRFWMLETIREFAAERLEASGEGPTFHRQHSEHFLALAEETEPHLFSEAAGEWHNRLEREHDNLRAALDWLEAEDENELLLRLAGALGEFWAVKGHLGEGHRRLEAALAADSRPTTARAKALNAAADLANGTGDIATARLRAEEGLELNRALGSSWGTADSLLVLAISANGSRDYARAYELIEESIGLFRELGDARNELEAKRILAWTHRELGEHDAARQLMEDIVVRARKLGDKQLESRSLDLLAGYALEEERVVDALRLLKEAHRINAASGDLYWLPFIVCRFAQALARTGKAETAVRVLSAGEALLDKMGSRPHWMQSSNERTRAAARSAMSDERFVEAWEEGRNLTAEDAVALALAQFESALTESKGAP